MNKAGILVHLLKADYGACDGIANFSSRVSKCILVASPDFPDVPEIHEVTKDCPAVAMVKRHLFHHEAPYLTAYPVLDGKIDTNRMAGGCYIKTSDSRFPAIYPVPLHDRIE